MDAFETTYVEHKSERDKKSSIKGYLEKIRPHLCYMIDDLKKSGKWKTRLTLKTLNFCHQLTVIKNVLCILRVIAVQS